MDTFMDKLADKINAQEMIRANTAAEVEELGRVKGQIESLKACVEETKALLEHMQTNLEQTGNVANQAENAANRAENVVNQAENAANQTQAASERVENAAEQMKAMAERMENIVAQIAQMQAGNETVKQAVTDPETETAEKKVPFDTDILYIIEDEVSQLSKSLENINVSKADEGNADFAELKAQMMNLQSELAQIGSLISNLQDQMTGDDEGMESVLAEIRKINQNSVYEDKLDALRSEIEKISENLAQDTGVNIVLAEVEKVNENLEQLKLEVLEPLDVEEKESVDYSEDISALKTQLSSLQETLLEMQGIMRDTQGAVLDAQGIMRDTQGAVLDAQDAMSKTQEQVGRLGEKDNEQGEGIADLKVELSRLDEHLTNVGASANSRTAESAEALRRFLAEQLDKLVKAKEQDQKEDKGSEIEELKAILEEIKNLQDEKKSQIEERLTGMHEGLREGYHKECVKVYRNVQASFSEENQRQTVMLEEKMGKSFGSAKIAMIFSILAFGMSLAGVVLQVLSLLKIL